MKILLTFFLRENAISKLLGKHIVAIIGKQGQENHELIVYKEKTNILIRETLNETVSFFKYTNNFIGFYDRTRCFWNLNFLTTEEYDSFLMELSKHRCAIILKTSENCSESNDIEKTKELHAIDKKNLIQKTPDSSELQQKNEILSRITKMGQPILPKNIVESKYVASQSDSETESSFSDTKPTVTPRKFKKCNGVLHERKFINSPNNENKLVLSTELSSNNQILGNNHMMMYPQGMFLSQPMPEYNMNNFLIAQNAELKNNIADINLKLSTMLSNQGGNMNSEEFKEAKSRVKCLNLKIDNLTTELDRLQKEHQDLKKSYNNKCKELSEEQEKVLTINTLSVDIDFVKNKILDNNKEIELLKMELSKKNELIEEQKVDVERLENYRKESETYKGVLSREIDELKLKLDEDCRKLKEYEDKCEKQQALLANFSSNNIAPNTIDSSKIIKGTMNATFTSIMSSFDENESYNYKYIQDTILTNLKHSSLRLITQFNAQNK